MNLIQDGKARFFSALKLGLSNKLLLREALLGAAALLFAITAAAGKQAPDTREAQSIKVEETKPNQDKAKPNQDKAKDATPAATKPSAHHFDRVVIVVLENGDYEVAVKDKNLAGLAEHGASFTNFHALFHPSYPNYLAMIAGTDFGVHRRGRYLADRQTNFPNDAAHKTIADRLIASGLDFKNYAEELPEGNCPYRIDSQHVAKSKKGDYVRRHVPFLSFGEVQEKWCDHVIRVNSATDDNFFVNDAKAGLVAYSFYSPNMTNDGHNTNVQVAAEWLHRFLDKSFPEKLRKGTLVIVTFDESDHNADNKIFTLFLGDMVKDGSQQDPKVLDRHYTHYNVLRTIEDNFGLEPLAAGDRDAAPITDIWK